MFTFDLYWDGFSDDAEPVRVTATSRDISHWERTGKGRSFGQIESNPSMSALEEIAYLAAHRQGCFPGSIAEFRETADIVPIAPDADEVGDTVPTRRAR